jgi:hypothetical protein
MRKLLSDKKASAVLLILTLLFLAFYVYMLARPISYGMGYHGKTDYAGEFFEGTLKFRSDGTMRNRNTNFDSEMEYRYYYKDGYVFALMGETEDACKAEIAYIDEHFEEASTMPFYAARVNAFQYVIEGADGYAMTYTCMSAIVFAVAAGAFVVLLMALFAASVVHRRKGPPQEEVIADI